MMYYKGRYEFRELENGLIEVYDLENDVYMKHEYLNIEQCLEAIKNYEDNLAEAAWYRSTQDGYYKGELQEQQAKNQKLK